MTTFNLKGAPRLWQVLSVAAIALVLLVAASGTAQAYKIKKTIKKPGEVTLYRVEGSHHPSQCPYGECWNPWIVQRGAVVGRSPKARGRQLVSIRYELQRWYNDSWNYQTHQTFFKYIPRGKKRIRMPRFDVVPTAANYMRVRVAIVWNKGHRTLGARLYVFNQQSDYVCVTQFENFCATGPGWIWVRAPDA